MDWLMPLLGAQVGWLTNWLALKNLQRVKGKREPLGVRLPNMRVSALVPFARLKRSLTLLRRALRHSNQFWKK